jgi:hypothetical protein
MRLLGAHRQRDAARASPQGVACALLGACQGGVVHTPRAVRALPLACWILRAAVHCTSPPVAAMRTEARRGAACALLCGRQGGAMRTSGAVRTLPRARRRPPRALPRARRMPYRA